MSIEMTLEIDGQLTSERALELLQANGFVEYDLLPGSFCSFHEESGLNAYFLADPELRTVLAAGLVPPKWTRKSVVTFRYSENYDASAFETMKFARTLASQSSAHFVLSFQYENVYAVRDEKGYREISDTSSTMQSPVE